MKRLIILLSILSLVFSACSTEPGETTGMGAAAGGAVGAGLGLLIGSSSGDPGTGLLVGAVAGSATGTLAGNYLEAQEDLMDHQDKVIARNANQLQGTRGELRNLRDNSQDQISDQARFSGDFSNPRSQARPRVAPKFPQGNVIKESTIVNPTNINPYMNQQQANLAQNSGSVRVSLGNTERPPRQIKAMQVAARSLPSLDSGISKECREAEGEISKVNGNTETADRLFHYRRALRLCPDNTQYHNTLGEIYLSLGRKADAEFEFKEALRLNPANPAAQKNLSTLTLNG